MHVEALDVGCCSFQTTHKHCLHTVSSGLGCLYKFRSVAFWLCNAGWPGKVTLSIVSGHTVLIRNATEIPDMCNPCSAHADSTCTRMCHPMAGFSEGSGQPQLRTYMKREPSRCKLKGARDFHPSKILNALAITDLNTCTPKS